ncbi:hypothetical protein H1235_00690 [Pseudoxanthomonas sp. NC8]|nr:hypothetical protein H1235_00690 [Pseudoxanthomonas sp. NC8]
MGLQGPVVLLQDLGAVFRCQPEQAPVVGTCEQQDFLHIKARGLQQFVGRRFEWDGGGFQPLRIAADQHQQSADVGGQRLQAHVVAQLRLADQGDCQRQCAIPGLHAGA